VNIIRCACYGEAVAVEKDPDGYVELAFWQHGHTKHRGLAFRIRHILKILRDGVPYTDMVMLSPAEAKSLAVSLIDAVESARLESAECTHGTHGEAEVHDPVSGEREA
jgi:hypothetical protein